jgi:hypothetical protein
VSTVLNVVYACVYVQHCWKGFATDVHLPPASRVGHSAGVSLKLPPCQKNVLILSRFFMVVLGSKNIDMR